MSTTPPQKNKRLVRTVIADYLAIEAQLLRFSRYYNPVPSSVSTQRLGEAKVAVLHNL